MPDRDAADISAIDLGQLRPLPQVLLKVAQACDRQAERDVKQLAQLVAQDFALTARVFDAARDERPAGRDDLLAVLQSLGVNGLSAIVGNAITRAFFSVTDDAHWQDCVVIWSKALGCALRCRALALAVELDNPHEAYLAGLLHDIGARIAAPGQAAEEVEQQTLCLLEQWRLPPAVVDAVLYRNVAFDALLDTQPMVKIINLALHFERAAQIDETLLDTAYGLLGVRPADLRAAFEQAEREHAEVLAAYALQTPEKVRQSIEETTLELARKVREYALLTGVCRDLGAAAEGHSLVRAVTRQIRLLFVVERLVLLRYCPDEAQLRVWPPLQHDGPLAGLGLAMASGRSLMADALLQQRMLHSFMPEFSALRPVVERQLARWLQGGGLLCAPMFIDGKRAGVIVAGIERQHCGKLEQQFPLLEALAEQTAQAMRRVERMASPPKDGSPA